MITSLVSDYTYTHSDDLVQSLNHLKIVRAILSFLCYALAHIACFKISYTNKP
jgi:hypothetical protein